MASATALKDGSFSLTHLLSLSLVVRVVENQKRLAYLSAPTQLNTESGLNFPIDPRKIETYNFVVSNAVNVIE